MIKVTDTLKRNIKFKSVWFDDNVLVDETGNVVDQIQEELPNGTTEFELIVNAVIPSNESE